MVDHRADEDQGLSFLVNAREDDGRHRPSLLQNARDWLSERFSRSGTSGGFSNLHRTNDMPLGEWLQTNRLALALSGIWAGALIAYGIGYFARLGSVEGTISVLPTLDLVFFVFAILGPIAMIWFAVAMVNRAAHLSDAIAGQSESALALAATITNLNDSVDALSNGTTGRLEQACDRMEREAAASVKTLERSLADATQQLETALLDGVILMDRNLKDRSDRVASALESQQDLIAQELRQSIGTIQTAFERESTDVGTRQRELVSRTDRDLSQTMLQLQTTLKDLGAQQKAGLGAASDMIEETTKGLAAELTRTLQQQISHVDQNLKTTNTELAKAATTTSQTIRKDLGEALTGLRSDVDEMRKTIAASPPATSEDLAALLGEAAHRIVSPERSALTQSVLRITALEEQARSLLEQIDRTSRLMPLLEARQTHSLPTRPMEESALFGELPASPARNSLNWTAVVHILVGAGPVPGTREVIDQTRKDPDVETLIRLRDEILGALGEHGLFAEDIKPDHCAPAIWHAWIAGDDTFEIVQLAGVRDEVSNAIARGWLRQNKENLGLALRFLQTYQGLLLRAVGDACEGRHLVELADTSAGRLFILLGGLNRLFNRPMTVTADATRH